MSESNNFPNSYEEFMQGMISFDITTDLDLQSFLSKYMDNGEYAVTCVADMWVKQNVSWLVDHMELKSLEDYDFHDGRIRFYICKNVDYISLPHDSFHDIIHARLIAGQNNYVTQQ